MYRLGYTILFIRKYILWNVMMEEIGASLLLFELLDVRLTAGYDNV
jgi:hypothetical protein